MERLRPRRSRTGLWNRRWAPSLRSAVAVSRGSLDAASGARSVRSSWIPLCSFDYGCLVSFVEMDPLCAKCVAHQLHWPAMQRYIPLRLLETILSPTAARSSSRLHSEFTPPHSLLLVVWLSPCPTAFQHSSYNVSSAILPQPIRSRRAQEGRGGGRP